MAMLLFEAACTPLERLMPPLITLRKLLVVLLSWFSLDLAGLKFAMSAKSQRGAGGSEPFYTVSYMSFQVPSEERERERDRHLEIYAFIFIHTRRMKSPPKTWALGLHFEQRPNEVRSSPESGRNALTPKRWPHPRCRGHKR